MNKYDIIYNILYEKVINNELTLEYASSINKLAYNKYCIDESADKSEFIKDFKKKSGKRFKYIDLDNKQAEFYMKRDDNISDKKMKFIKDTFNGCIAVDTENDKYAGYIYIIKNDNTLSPLWVFKKYRGYGLGEALLKKAINDYDADGLWVYTDNAVAINLYKKYGFKETKHKKKLKDGEQVFMDLRYKK